MATTTQNPSDAQQGITGVEQLKTIDASQVGAISTAVLVGSRWIADAKYVIKGLRTNVGTCGTAGATTVVANVNGVAVTGLSVSTDNAEADGITKVDAPTAETTINPGDVVDIEVTAAPTGGADLTAQLLLAKVLDA